MIDYTGLQVANTPNSFLAQKRINTFQVRFAKQDGILETLEGTVHYLKGDAIITGLLGEEWASNPQHFAASYSPLPPTSMWTDGNYQNKPIQAFALLITRDCRVRLHNGDFLYGSAGDYLLQYRDRECGNYGIVTGRVFDTLYDTVNTNHSTTVASGRL